MLVPLSRYQSAIVSHIRRAIIATGRPPTVRQLCRLCGCTSPNGVLHHLRAMTRLGYLKRVPGRSAVYVLKHPEVHVVPVGGLVHLVTTGPVEFTASGLRQWALNLIHQLEQEIAA